ncbi:MAG: Fe(3+) ABC transporter substrate-binding protein [Halofilum sp. (in: g-proteobacteria)]|nr:Fe(3+) ABC transporter substrate-binding protein [Halofilum sp. (in: g-proteobacteria)]
MRSLPAIVFVAASLLSVPPATAAESVNLYSARQEALIAPLLERFTERTGIEVNLVTGSADALIKRLEVEGRNTPADMLITVDAGRLHRAKSAGLFRATESERLAARVPAHLRDDDHQWFGLSQRARVIAYSTERVDPSELSTYEALADEQWNDRICVRSSDNIYNQSLLASIVAAKGEQAATAWARGVVENMARRPQGGDRDQIMAVAAGVCDVAIVNTYYYGRMRSEQAQPDQRAAAQKVALFFPNQGGRGTHVNVSGAGVTEHARNPDNAVRLLEFLVSDAAQRWYAKVNYEYPVVPGVDVSAAVREWGYPFERDDLPLSRLGELNATAVRIFDRVGWR